MELFKLFGTIALNNSEAIKGIKDTTDHADDASSKIDVAFEKIGNAALKVGKVMAVGLGAGVVAISAITKKALDSYAEYEQLIGGVETLYGTEIKSIEEYAASLGKTTEEVTQQYEMLMNRQNDVLENANNAYKTAGMSANEYMETVNGFAASLTSSLGEYEFQAAGYAEMIVTDMADNANKMGTSMESIQNAYSGFAKQNYTMLDNLKLGYGGTKEEMERLMRDAEKFAGYVEGSLDIDSFADVSEAIHIVQEEMGIAGTTAKEAAETISGSTASMKASWKNLVTGLGNDNADLSKLIDEFVDSTVIAAKNILPRIEQILKGIADLVKKIVPQITSMLPGLIANVLPPLLAAAASLIQGLADAIPDLLDILLEVLPEFIDLGVEIVDSILEGILDNIGKMGTSATQIVVKLTTGILQLLPKFLEVGAKLIVSIIQGISQSLPQIIKTITDVALQMVDVLIENLPLFVESGLQFIVSLTEGILDALPDLLAKMPEIVQQLVEAILDNIGLIINAGVQLLTALVDNLPIIIDTIIAVMPLIITAIINALTSEDGLASIIQAGVTLLTALIDNIDEIITTIITAIPVLIDAIFKAFTSEDALSSMAEAGVDIIYSLLEGLKSAWDSVASWASGAVDWLKETFRIDLFNEMNVPTEIQGGSLGSTSRSSTGKTSSSSGFKRVGQYAEGGVVPKGQIAFLEGYGTEAVVPLEKNKQWIGKVADDMDSALGGKDTANKLDKLIALQEQMLEIMPELANISINLNNREFGRAVRQVNA